MAGTAPPWFPGHGNGPDANAMNDAVIESAPPVLETTDYPATAYSRHSLHLLV